MTGIIISTWFLSCLWLCCVTSSINWSQATLHLGASCENIECECGAAELLLSDIAMMRSHLLDHRPPNTWTLLGPGGSRIEGLLLRLIWKLRNYYKFSVISRLNGIYKAWYCQRETSSVRIEIYSELYSTTSSQNYVFKDNKFSILGEEETQWWVTHH